MVIVKINDPQSNQTANLPVDENGLLSFTLLTGHFHGAAGIFYRSNDDWIAVRFDESAKKFLPPGGEWTGKEFYVSRPEGSISSVQEDAGRFDILKKYVYVINGANCCATAIAPYVLATCYHCIKSCILDSSDLDEEARHRSTMVNLTGPNKESITTTIEFYSIEHDLVFLKTLTKLMEQEEIGIGDSWVGQPYYIIGTPTTDEGSDVQMLSGRISGKIQHTLDIESYLLQGHGAARPGSSGGAVFSRSLESGKPSLLGIVHGGQRITDLTQLVTFISAHYVKIISSTTLGNVYPVLKKNGAVFKF